MGSKTKMYVNFDKDYNALREETERKEREKNPITPHKRPVLKGRKLTEEEVNRFKNRANRGKKK